MKLSKKTRYGSRAMATLAMAYPEEPVSVGQVARQQRLSAKYLEQIMAALKTAGLVTSTQGVHGGYSLARPPESINLGDVFNVLEGPTAPVDCVDNPGTCSMEAVCPTRDTWVEIEEAIRKVLKNTTLQDLVERMKSKSDGLSRMYQI
ncbi:RrF2 family transcriptional regulator [Planctomycetota bacterium]